MNSVKKIIQWRPSIRLSSGTVPRGSAALIVCGYLVLFLSGKGGMAAQTRMVQPLASFGGVEHGAAAGVGLRYAPALAVASWLSNLLWRLGRGSRGTFN